MLNTAAKAIVLLMLTTTTALADSDLSPFNQQGDIDYPAPNSEESYFAFKSPMSSDFTSYIGINAGLGMTSYKSNVTATNSVNNANYLSNDKTPNYNFGLYGGGGVNLGNVYLGVELSGGYNIAYKNVPLNFNNPALNPTAAIAIRQPLVAGIDFIPGYLTYAKDMLFYGRAGVGASLFNLQLTDNSNPNNPTYNTAHKIVPGIRAGAGAMFFLSDSFSLHLEYIFARYSQITYSYALSSLAPLVYNYKLGSQTTHQVNLGLAYHF